MNALVAVLLLSSPPTIMRDSFTEVDDPDDAPIDVEAAETASDIFTWGGIGVMVPLVATGAALASNANDQLHPVGYVTVASGIVLGLIGIGIGALIDPD